MPCIDLFVCVLLCSMNFGAQDVALKNAYSNSPSKVPTKVRMELDSARLLAWTVQENIQPCFFLSSKNALGQCRQLSTLDSEFSFSLANQHGKLPIGNMLIFALPKSLEKGLKRAAPEVRMAGWQPNSFIPMRFNGPAHFGNRC